MAVATVRVHSHIVRVVATNDVAALVRAVHGFRPEETAVAQVRPRDSAFIRDSESVDLPRGGMVRLNNALVRRVDGHAGDCR